MADQPPGDRPQVIMAAPNESRIRARVHRVERSEQWPDKWHLEVEILDSRAVHGASFAAAGQRVRAFAFGEEAPARPSTIISGRAEYIGGQRHGEFKLWDITAEADQRRLGGVVEFPEGVPAFQNARMSVVVEDVTRADAPSTQVARQVLDGISAAGDRSSVPFSLPVESLDPRKSYSLTVHVDVDRDGTISTGDYISMQSYPVTTESTNLVVKVQVVHS